MNVENYRFAPFRPEYIIRFLRETFELPENTVCVSDQNNRCFIYKFSNSVSIFLYWSDMYGERIKFIFDRQKDDANCITQEQYEELMRRVKRFFYSFGLESCIQSEKEGTMFFVDEDTFIEKLKKT